MATSGARECDFARLNNDFGWKTPTVLFPEREYDLYGSYGHVHEFLIVFHRAHSTRIHETHTDQQGKNIRVSLYDSMCEMDKDGKKMVSELVYRHAV